MRRSAACLVAAAALAGPTAASGSSTQGVSASAKTQEVNGQLVLVCDAEATGAAASTEITQCYTTNGGWAPAVAVPGPVAATANVVSVPPGPYQVCVEARATFLAGDKQEIRTSLHCFGSQLIGVGGAQSGRGDR
jgi:hypothetical protein